MDVTGVAWRTSSYSGDNGGACVEVGTTGPAVAVRDSKHPDGPQLAFARRSLEGLHQPAEGDRLTRDELLARLAGLRQAPIDQKRAPHKPLLLLWLFGQFEGPADLGRGVRLLPDDRRAATRVRLPPRHAGPRSRSQDVGCRSTARPRWPTPSPNSCRRQCRDGVRRLTGRQ